MSFEFREENDYLLLRLSGTVDADDLRRLVEAFERHEGAGQRVKNRITDLTGMEDTEVGFPEILPIATRRAHQKLSTQVKAAIIANRPLRVGYARMFQMLNENPIMEIRIFESVEQALRWFEAG